MVQRFTMKYISGFTSTTLVDSAKKMYKNTNKQAKSIGKQLPQAIKSVYVGDNTSKILPSYEPKMANRWLIKFPKKVNITDWVGKAVTLPTYPFNLGGKITVVLHDPVYPSTTDSLVKFVENQKPFKLKIDVLDPLAVSVGKWILKGCLITSIDWTTLDYSTKEPMSIYLTISYNEVKYKSK